MADLAGGRSENNPDFDNCRNYLGNNLALGLIPLVISIILIESGLLRIYVTVINDLDGKIVFTNPKFTETTGYTAEEVLGQNPKILKTEDTQISSHRNLWEPLLAGQSWHGVFRNKKKNGDLYWESAVISPVKGETGKTTSMANKTDEHPPGANRPCPVSSERSRAKLRYD